MSDKQYRLKTKHNDGTPTMNSKIGAALKHSNDQIADTVIGAHKKIENAVVGTYKKVEQAFTEKFLEEILPGEKSNGKSDEKHSNQ